MRLIRRSVGQNSPGLPLSENHYMATGDRLFAMCNRIELYVAIIYLADALWDSSRCFPKALDSPPVLE